MLLLLAGAPQLSGRLEILCKTLIAVRSSCWAEPRFQQFAKGRFGTPVAAYGGSHAIEQTTNAHNNHLSIGLRNLFRTVRESPFG
ncbi:MAG: hypothetical protein DMG97_07135 [Acidobacteria bacterium]|nr:MAG: hypothetical protein DMG97_07135 [Acidobacteriota bacterium]